MKKSNRPQRQRQPQRQPLVLDRPENAVERLARIGRLQAPRIPQDSETKKLLRQFRP